MHQQSAPGGTGQATGVDRSRETGSGDADRRVTTADPDRRVTNADPDRRVTTAVAAHLAGVKASTWRSWRAQRRPRPEPAPEPDGWFEMRTPWWWESTIVDWVDRRRAHLAEQRPHPDESG